MARSCYVHIPFCAHICHYCAFCHQVYQKDNVDLWKQRLLQEIKQKNPQHISTLYFGGGTPNVLSLSDFEQLAFQLKPSLAADYEWTVECNPEHVRYEQAQAYKKWGVNRISMGVQTFNDSLLESIGRGHHLKDVISAICWFRQEGIDNISIDLIYGLPHQTLGDVKRDLDIFFSLDLPHLSIYSLQIEPGTRFAHQGVKACESDLEADMYETIVKTCKEHGYDHYEISSFARNGRISRHNMAYWSDQDFIGIGCGASGKENGILYENTRSVQTYIQKGAMPTMQEESVSDRAFDAIMMSLRTMYGLDVSVWEQKYQMDFSVKYAKVLERYVPDFLTWRGARLCPTEKGMEILNTILVDFLDSH